MDTSVENVDQIQMVEFEDSRYRMYKGQTSVCGIGNYLFVYGHTQTYSRENKLLIYDIENLMKWNKEPVSAQSFNIGPNGSIFGVTCSETHLFVVYRQRIQIVNLKDILKFDILTHPTIEIDDLEDNLDVLAHAYFDNGTKNLFLMKGRKTGLQIIDFSEGIDEKNIRSRIIETPFDRGKSYSNFLSFELSNLLKNPTCSVPGWWYS